MTSRTKWLLAGIGALLVAMLAYAVAGPYLAINGIRNVVAKGEYGELVRFVDKFDLPLKSVKIHFKLVFQFVFAKDQEPHIDPKPPSFQGAKLVDGSFYRLDTNWLSK